MPLNYEEYTKYISSPEWKIKRQIFIQTAINFDLDKSNGDESRRYECQRCGWNFRQNEIEVHHKHYRSLGKERPQDVLIVCKPCHDKLDRLRANEGRLRSAEALDSAQFRGWIEKKYENREDDIDYLDFDNEYEKFNAWRERKDANW